ncbi:MAG: ThiF family adenylyltransferase [Coriobacteriales bacterium]|nr:ThiF family adenylyltransferase [Coriobacteriales bacterium]
MYGAIAGWFGQVSTVFPGDVGFVNIYGSTKSDGAKDQGNLPFTASCVASHMSAEVIKVLLNKQDLLRNRLLMVDMQYGSCEVIELS